MLKKKIATSPTDAQLSKAMDQIEEELHAIIFMYKTDRHKYGNILGQWKMMYYKERPIPKNCEQF